MKARFVLLSLLPLIFAINACSPLTIVSASGQQPEPRIVVEGPLTGYQPLAIDDVQAEVGVGSPIPVIVHVTGVLPGRCSQVEYTEIRQDGSNFIVNLYSTPVGSMAEGCLQDAAPFKLSVPLNVVNLPGGDYTVTVNGVRAGFRLDVATPPAPLRTADMPIDKADVRVDDVKIETDSSTGATVTAVISANLPMTCAQLGEIRLHRDNNVFFVRLVAYIPVPADCSGETLPLLLRVPLNTADLPAGSYQVNVNGAESGFQVAPAK